MARIRFDLMMLTMTMIMQVVMEVEINKSMIRGTRVGDDDDDNDKNDVEMMICLIN